MHIPLGYQDSNLEWLNQNQLCCQLHHTPITRHFVLISRESRTSFRAEEEITKPLPVFYKPAGQKLFSASDRATRACPGPMVATSLAGRLRGSYPAHGHLSAEQLDRLVQRRTDM